MRLAAGVPRAQWWDLGRLTYSKFINGLSKCGVTIDRKILAEIAYDSPEAFKTIVQKAQSALN